MNKKVSTLLTVAMMLGGSLLSSSAFAQDTSIKGAKNDATYYLIPTHYYDATSSSWKSKGEMYVKYNAADDVFELEEKKADATPFVVNLEKDANGEVTGVSFTVANSTKKLTVADQNRFALGASASITSGTTSIDCFGLTWTVTESDGTKKSFELGLAKGGNEDGDDLVAHQKGDGTTEVDSNIANLYALEEVPAVEAGEDLNDLYNNKGFNLTAGEDVADNLFDSESRVWAFEVTDKDGYKISKAGANGKDLVIPEGVYFFTDLVLNDGVTEAKKSADINWLASTLIAVSPETTVEQTVTDRDKGQGFKLITASPNDFIFSGNTSEYVVGEMPIENACFAAMNNNAGKYAIRLDNFYYKKNNSDEDGAALVKAPVDLVVLSFTDGTKSLSTTPAGDAWDYIFSLSDSSVKDGIELLNTEKKAAVYNIRFVKGISAEQQNLVGKYLTVGVKTTTNEVADDDDFVWVAKGSDISKLNYPSFQYTITAVEKEDGKKNDADAKYVNVTFTNRETNESFTAKLFPEEGGANYYSLSFVENAIKTVTPVDVQRNNYGVKAQNAATINSDVVIELIPSTVDEYAGFLDVADESVRTIRLARDKFDTSNMWYVGVGMNGSNYTLTPSGYPNGYFVEDAYDAAQFQLEKAAKPDSIARTFVYNAGTGSVNDVVNGDKVYAYKYNLEYLNDGTETTWYLNDASGVVMSQTAKPYYIKENADGSVSIFGIGDAFNGAKVTIAEKNVTLDAKMNADYNYAEYLKGTPSEGRSAIYAYTSSDMNLKTYLDDEIDNLSWDSEGHVTLKNGTEGVAGNYISMNESNEAVVIDDADETLYLHMTDVNAVVPSFYISKGMGEGSNALSERMFLFNPTDSVNYQVTTEYDPNYQVAKAKTKAIFKAGTLDASRDTMAITVKGEVRQIAQNSDNDGTWAGLDRFKWQIIETADADGYYNIRQVGGYTDDKGVTYTTGYLASQNEKLYISKEKSDAMAIFVDPVAAPTANEGVSATEVKVIATDGAINIKNAAGKNVVVSTILGQIVANEVLTSDNATISVPAGIAIVSVEGEEAVKVSVK